VIGLDALRLIERPPRGAAPAALAIHQALQRQPIATAASRAKATGLTTATVNKSLDHLECIGVVGEFTNRRRDRVFRGGRLPLRALQCTRSIEE
jgi:Fic family protein